MLKKGDLIPEFELPDQNSDNFNIKEVLGKGKLAIYFYPKDNTPGCTKEACSFRDNYEYLNSKNVTVIGISRDSVESHSNFAKKYNLPFKLLSDVDGKVSRMFGVPSFLILFPSRVTFLVDENGRVEEIISSQFNIDKHISGVTELINKK